MNGNNTSVKLLIALNYMYYAFYKGGGVEDVIHCNQYSELKKRKKKNKSIYVCKHTPPHVKQQKLWYELVK